MKKTFIGCLAMATIALWAGSAAANSIDVGLERIPWASELSSHFHLNIFDDDHSSDRTAEQVLFSFTSDAVIPMSVAEIYVNGDGLYKRNRGYYPRHRKGHAFFGLRGNTNAGGASGGNAGGASGRIGARVGAHDGAHDGLNRAGENLRVVLTLIPDATLEKIIDKLHGPPWIAIQPGNDGGEGDIVDGGGDTSPVPEPTSMVLFGLGTAGLIGLRKKQRRNR